MRTSPFISRMVKSFLLCLVLLVGLASPALPQEPARLQLGASSLAAEDSFWNHSPSLDLKLVLDRAVPYRTVIVSEPVRLIVDLKETDLSGLNSADLFGQEHVPAIRWGRLKRDWSRIVIELPGTYRIDSAGMSTKTPQPEIRVRLEPVNEADFAALPSASAALRNLPDTAALPKDPPPDEALTIMIDPGHGGHDPGAMADGQSEARIVLGFAQELRTALEAKGIEVAMTRENDSFIALEDRMTMARDANADLFLSLHADALPSGQAAGATVYVWTPGADNRAAQQLAARHGRSDLLAGVDLTGQDDQLAAVMMDFVRTDTQQRSENFASFLRSRMALKGIGLHGRPVQGAAFSVLKSPDIASVLLELGFITDAEDRAKLTDPAWRADMVDVLVEAITDWASDEAARKSGLRK